MSLVCLAVLAVLLDVAARDAAAGRLMLVAAVAMARRSCDHEQCWGEVAVTSTSVAVGGEQTAHSSNLKR